MAPADSTDRDIHHTRDCPSSRAVWTTGQGTYQPFRREATVVFTRPTNTVSGMPRGADLPRGVAATTRTCASTSASAFPLPGWRGWPNLSGTVSSPCSLAVGPPGSGRGGRNWPCDRRAKDEQMRRLISAGLLASTCVRRARREPKACTRAEGGNVGVSGVGVWGSVLCAEPQQW